MRILVATDAWEPQINGVVRTLAALVRTGEEFGASFALLSPDQFPTVPLPGYPEIRLAVPSLRKLARRIADAKADRIHIMTEGPVGFLTRRYCLAHGIPFTTSFHTRYPDYVSARVPIPRRWTWSLLRRFHNAGQGVMAATPALIAELESRGFRNIMLWPLGVDTELFRPRPGADLGLARPVFLNVGRLAVEKNLEAFLSLDLPGSKVVVGDGPARRQLERQFPNTVFLGKQEGETLACSFAAADVLVFPSRTDTFGLVLLEALASGLPVAAFPVSGPLDVIGDAPVAVLDHDLRTAAIAALEIPRAACRDVGLRYSWRESAHAFFDNVARAGASAPSHGPEANASRVTNEQARPSVLV